MEMVTIEVDDRSYRYKDREFYREGMVFRR